MRSSDSVARELAELIQSHYYSEDFQLLSAVRQYHDALNAAEREWLKAEILRRLQTDGTLVEALLCGVVYTPDAVPTLAAMLGRETSATQLSRALIGALRKYSDSSAYAAVERFLDSEQEREALAALADMDFARAIPHLDRRLRKNEFLDACLHIFADRRTKLGLDAFVNEIRAYASVRAPEFRERFFEIITSKQPLYNPFTADEIGILMKALEQA